MNYAVEGLKMLRDAGIPVVSIEGNHDQKHNDSEFSWLRSLAAWDLMILLEPETENGEMTYLPWNPANRKGGYIDIGRARIFGSDWYGASGNWAIPMLTTAIGENLRKGAFHILMLHTDVEGHQMHPIPALSLSALKELKAVTDYVGLGHTHKHYEIDNWAFNPGSIEITNISEYRETRGAFLVEVSDENQVTTRHIEDYHYRPFQQLQFNVSNYDDAARITEDLIKMIEVEARSVESGKPKPIIEISLRGQLGMPNSLLELKKIRESAAKITGALHVRIKNHTVPADFLESVENIEDTGRDLLERRVIADLVVRDNRFKSRTDEISDAIIGAKRMALGDESAEKIADFIALMVNNDSTKS
jgi:DNA repair exonuclease SbcCD nuclease subunit